MRRIEVPITVSKKRGRPSKVDQAINAYFQSNPEKDPANSAVEKFVKKNNKVIKILSQGPVDIIEEDLFSIGDATKTIDVPGGLATNPHYKPAKDRSINVGTTPVEKFVVKQIVCPTVITDKIHAKFGSPSGLSKIEKCPGSIAYGKDIPEPPTSIYAEEGNVFHAYMESLTSSVLEGSIIMPPADPQYVDMAEHVRETLEKVKEYWDHFESKHSNAKFYVELKVKVDNEIFGTADLVFTGINKKSKKTDVIVIDHKFGVGVKVVAEENRQGIAYLLGAIETLNIKYQDVGKAGIIIAQVRLDDGWSQYRIPTNDLTVWRKKFHTWVTNAKEMYEGKQEIYLKAGSHCRFCKCLPTCKEAHKTHIEDVSLHAEEMPVLDHLTLEDQVKIFLAKSKIEDFLNSVAKSLKDKAMTGLEIPGVKLIQTNGRRGWIKNEDEVISFLESHNINPHTLKLRSMGDVEKQLGKTKKILDRVIGVSEGKIELVSLHDKRPQIVNIENLQNKLEELPED